MLKILNYWLVKQYQKIIYYMIKMDFKLELLRVLFNKKIFIPFNYKYN